MERQPFDTRAGFQAGLDAVFGRARLTLKMFDPDFASWELGSARNDALLRTFLRGGGRLQLVTHSNARLERDAPAAQLRSPGRVPADEPLAAPPDRFVLRR